MANNITKKTGFKVKKRKINTMRLVLLIIVGLVVAYFVISAIKIVNLNNEREQVAKENQQLKETVEDLTQQLEIINSDQYMEGLARKRLKLVHSNEILFILPDLRVNNDDEQVGPTDIALEEAQQMLEAKEAEKAAKAEEEAAKAEEEGTGEDKDKDQDGGEG